MIAVHLGFALACLGLCLTIGAASLADMKGWTGRVSERIVNAGVLISSGGLGLAVVSLCVLEWSSWVSQ